MEERKRTFVRTAIWRICAYCGTSVVIFVLTKDLSKSFSFGLIDHSIKFVFQYIYERLWNKTKWGIINVDNFCEIKDFNNVL